MNKNLHILSKKSKIDVSIIEKTLSNNDKIKTPINLQYLSKEVFEDKTYINMNFMMSDSCDSGYQ